MIKILKFYEYNLFRNYETVGYYYFVIEIIYANIAKFTLYYKLNVFISGLIFFIIFIVCYKFDIKLFTIFSESINDIFSLQILQGPVYVKEINIFISCLDFILQWKLIFIIIIFIIFYIILYNSYGLKESWRIIVGYIYRRLNFLLNLEIFTYCLDFNSLDFIEYNFIFIISIILLFIIKIINYIIYGKVINFNLIHFLGLPYLCTLFIYTYLIHSNYLFELLHPIWSVNRNFFLMRYTDIPAKK